MKCVCVWLGAGCEVSGWVRALGICVCVWFAVEWVVSGGAGEGSGILVLCLCVL